MLVICENYYRCGAVRCMHKKPHEIDTPLASCMVNAVCNNRLEKVANMRKERRNYGNKLP